MGDTVASLAQQLHAHITKCEAGQVRVEEQLTSVSKDVAVVVEEVRAIKQLPGQAIKWLVATIATAALTILTQNFILHNETARVAKSAANAAASAAAETHAVHATVNAIEQHTTTQ